MTITTTAIDPHKVLCDSCSKDWSDSDLFGGLLFGSKAYCPDCVPGLEQSIYEHGEERFIKGRCPVGMSYADWVRDLRGPNPEAKIYSGEDFHKAFGTRKASGPDYSDD